MVIDTLLGSLRRIAAVAMARPCSLPGVNARVATKRVMIGGGVVNANGSTKTPNATSTRAMMPPAMMPRRPCAGIRGGA